VLLIAKVATPLELSVAWPSVAPSSKVTVPEASVKALLTVAVRTTTAPKAVLAAAVLKVVVVVFCVMVCVRLAAVLQLKFTSPA